jgi:hypothetical protein
MILLESQEGLSNSNYEINVLLVVLSGRYRQVAIYAAMS